MSTTNLPSSSIGIFPFAKNRPDDRNARIFYENNVANIIRQLCDGEGFIVSPPQTQSVEGWFSIKNVDGKYYLSFDEPEAVLQLNIGGYFVEVKSDSKDETVLFPLPEKSEDGVYAYIKVSEASREVEGQDSGSKFQGVTFSTREPSDETGYKTYCLKILDVSVGEGTGNGPTIESCSMCKDSYLIFNMDRFNIDCIDGKRNIKI